MKFIIDILLRRTKALEIRVNLLEEIILRREIEKLNTKSSKLNHQSIIDIKSFDKKLGNRNNDF